MTDASRVASWRRRLGLVLLLSLFVLGLVWVGLDVWAGRRVNAELARLEARHGSLDGRSIVAAPVPAEDNRAKVIRAAAALTVRGRQASPYGTVSAAIVRLENDPEPPRVPDELRAFVDVNAEAIRMAGHARRRRQASWDADYAGGANMPPFLDIRTLSQAIYVAALIDLDAHRPDAAASDITSGLAVAASLRQEPALIAQLIRIAVTFEQCHALERLIAQSEPSSDALEDLAGWLAESGAPDPIQVGLRAELQYGNGVLARMETGGSPSPEFAATPGWLRRLGPIGRPFVRLARLQYLRGVERLMEIQAGPRPHQTLMAPARGRRWNWWTLPTDFTAGLERSIETGDTFKSVLAVSEIGVALRRYRLDRGIYPDDLAALLPQYLPRLPVESVSGRPPAYARRGDGFTLGAEPVARTSPGNAALDWRIPR